MGADSISGFARKSGLSDSAMRKYLKGTSFPALDNLVAIAHAASVTVGWLANAEGVPVRNDHSESGVMPPLRDEQALYDSSRTVTLDTSSADYVRVPFYDVPLNAGALDGGVPFHEVDVIHSERGMLRSYLRDECGMDPDRAFIAPVKGQSMQHLLYDQDLIVGEVQDYIDRQGIFALVVNGFYYIKHVLPGPKRGDLTLVSENTLYPPVTLQGDSGDDVHIIGRYVRRITR